MTTRRYRPMRSLLWAARSLLLGIGVATALGVGAVASADDSPHLRMGNPSHASGQTGDKNNFLLKKEFFAVSYNNVKGTPNWVSWRLSKEDLGSAPRRPFAPDTTLPSGFNQVLPS